LAARQVSANVSTWIDPPLAAVAIP